MPRTPVSVPLMSLVAAALLVAACAESDAPPTSPLQDTATPPPATGTTRPLPTFTPTPGNGGATPAPDEEALRERVAGEAISRLAEWTGVAETELQLVAIEAVDWPSACLGVDLPGLACAEVITPGYRVEITHAARPDVSFEVHANRSGRYVWAPLMDTVRTVSALNFDDNRVVLESTAGLDEMGSEHRIVPGSYLEEPFAEFAPGDRVHIAIAHALPDEEFGLVVWMVRVAP